MSYINANNALPTELINEIQKYVNGVTSSGKTSIVEALQEREDVFFLWLQMIYLNKW